MWPFLDKHNTPSFVSKLVIIRQFYRTKVSMTGSQTCVKYFDLCGLCSTEVVPHQTNLEHDYNLVCNLCTIVPHKLPFSLCDDKSCFAFFWMYQWKGIIWFWIIAVIVCLHFTRSRWMQWSESRYTIWLGWRLTTVALSRAHTAIMAK